MFAFGCFAGWEAPPWPGPNEATNGNLRERYRLAVTPKGIYITAQTSAGLYYSVQTIRQLMQGAGNAAFVLTITIEDQSRPAGFVFEM